MATVNFSIPDDVKQAFNEIFAGHNKSAIIAALMRQAIDEAERQRSRAAAIRRLKGRRGKRPAVSNTAIRKARESGRA